MEPSAVGTRARICARVASARHNGLPRSAQAARDRGCQGSTRSFEDFWAPALWWSRGHDLGLCPLYGCACERGGGRVIKADSKAGIGVSGCFPKPLAAVQR